jgi:AraC-like DNA-binding protein
VECVWALEDPAASVHTVPPDGCLDIVWSPGEALRAVGAMTRQECFPAPAGSLTVGLRFRPGMANRFLGAAPGELTDRIVRLEELWGGRARRIEAQVSEARTSYEAMNLLLAALPVPSEPPAGPERAIEAMAAAHGWVNLDWIAGQANLSPRQFRRRCLESSGLAPKHLCRILRFRRASRLAAHATGLNWAAIAAECGYFDQAHLIRDFREFTGHAPMAVFSNRAAALAAKLGT